MSKIIELVKQQESFFVPAISDNAVVWQKECQFAIQLFQANDYLAKTALMNPASAQNAIINVAAIGVSLNPALKHAYLVPRKGKICLDISYMGLMNLAAESGSILWGQSVIVRQGEEFQLTELGKAPIHKRNPFDTSGEIIGAYCTVKTPNGDFITECMSIADIYNIRDRSEGYKKGGQSPWRSDEGEMIRKTVVKRASKYWLRSDRLSNAIEVLNTENGEGFEKEPVMPYYSEEQAREEKLIQNQNFENQVGELMEHMAHSQTMHDLKTHFQTAYKMTAGSPMQKSVQAVYAEHKARIEA